MTREEARSFLIDISYKLGNMSVEYLTEKDGEKMREAIKALKQEPCEDAVSRQAAIDAVAFGITYATGINMETGEVSHPFAESNQELRKAIHRICELPPVNPQSKTGHWIFDEILDKHYYCSECKSMGVDYWDFCPNCGAKMVEPQEREEV